MLIIFDLNSALFYENYIHVSFFLFFCFFFFCHQSDTGFGYTGRIQCACNLLYVLVKGEESALMKYI